MLLFKSLFLLTIELESQNINGAGISFALRGKPTGSCPSVIQKVIKVSQWGYVRHQFVVIGPNYT